MPDSQTDRSDRTFRIDGVIVELDAVAELSHACDPGVCAGHRSCCAEYEVRVTREEVSRIAGLMPGASRYARQLEVDGELDNVFDGLEHGICALETDEEGVCCFAYKGSGGAFLCSLHSAAIDLGLDPYEAKPEACTLWPLALVETAPPVLSVQPDAYRFPCNHRRDGAVRALDPGVRRIVEVLFGAEFAGRLQEAVREWMECEG
jgi:hypothetical protein